MVAKVKSPAESNRPGSERDNKEAIIMNTNQLISNYIGPVCGDSLRAEIQRNAFNALVAFYVAHGFTDAHAEWSAENDRAAGDRNWKKALRGEQL